MRGCVMRGCVIRGCVMRGCVRTGKSSSTNAPGNPADANQQHNSAKATVCFESSTASA